MQDDIQCVIPCGGNGTRMGANTSKCLLKVGTSTVLGMVVDYWRAYGIDKFIFIIGGSSAYQINDHILELCPKATIVDRGDIQNLAKAIALTKKYVNDRFILALGDCLNFGQFVSTEYSLGVGVCITDKQEMAKNYLVKVYGENIRELIEKPPAKMDGLTGMGTYFFDGRVFDYIERLKLANNATSVDLTGALQLAIGEGEQISPVLFKGDYINVTYPHDIDTACKLARLYNNINLTMKVLCC